MYACMHAHACVCMFVSLCVCLCDKHHKNNDIMLNKLFFPFNPLQVRAIHQSWGVLPILRYTCTGCMCRANAPVFGHFLYLSAEEM